VPKHAFYAQSGGVTAVINASAAGVIAASRRHSSQISGVLAGQNGILGALQEKLIDTSEWSDDQIQSLSERPGGVFGSCRYKLKSWEQHRQEYERLIEVFRAHNIGYFFYNGGGDSADTCLKVSELAKQMRYPLQAVHIPKTIDNDLPHTDCCPGFGSVAKYVATSIREASMDVRSMCATSTQVFILEVMGRHTGWITAACGLASENADEAPHVLLFPEIPFEATAFLDQVKNMVTRLGYCVIAVSEGLRDPQGHLISDHGTRDAFGHQQLGGIAPYLAQMIQHQLSLKCHWAVADYLQRSARHLASQIDVEQAYALGEAAVDLAVQGASAVMPTIERIQDEPYEWRIGSVEVHKIANIERTMPRDFIREDGFHITPAAQRYLLPLIQGEAWPTFKQGLPYYEFLPMLYCTQKLPKWNHLV
jgi:6-phosphofructokinase